MNEPIARPHHKRPVSNVASPVDVFGTLLNTIDIVITFALFIGVFFAYYVAFSAGRMDVMLLGITTVGFIVAYICKTLAFGGLYCLVEIAQNTRNKS